MKIILIVVTSLDGITYQKNKSPESHHEWTSQEDRDFFNKIRDESSLIFMGSKTYEGARHQMVHRDGKLRIVFTRNPKKYSQEKIPNQLEFTNENPSTIIKELEKKGFTEALLVGGAEITTEFFRENLVSTIYQTIEPVIVGVGVGILTKDMKINLELLESKKLNEKGTLLLKYKVIKNQ